MNDLNTIFPGKEVQIGGETIVVKPFTFGQLPKVMKLMNKLSGPMMAASNAGQPIDTGLMLSLLAEGSDELVSLLAASASLSVDTVNRLQSDEGIVLLDAFISVNGSFFVQRVLPLIKSLVEKHQGGQK